MKRYSLFVAVLLAAACQSEAPDLQLNDLGYFERQGVNVLVFSNPFSGGFNDEKNSGIEIIHHGVRTVQGGAVRLNVTPEQWDLVPTMTSRVVDTLAQTIEVGMRFDWYDFDSRVVVEPKGKAVEISVWLDKPVPEVLAGEAGFNLEFLPSQYWNKAYLVDGKPNRFPRYAVSDTKVRPNAEKVRQFKGYRTYDDRGTGEFIEPLPLSAGHEFLLAPDDPERMVKVASESEIKLYDGRMLAQNGWYVLRTVLPAGQTGKVVSWTVEPNAVPGWIREPNVGFSQMGYVPGQPKVAVIELDKKDKVKAKASVWKVEADGSEREAFSGPVKVWGDFFKYNYAKFDFSPLREPGVYFLKYSDVRTGNFIIDPSVYDKITVATSDVWIPVHMNHMAVHEAYRLWHGEPFKEGYLQAPPSTDHFDLHGQGPTTDTRFKALELIPGLNVGGYFDAGDFDIETGSNISVVMNLITLWERFRSERDETFVSEEQRYVELHRPDGVPDILQYIEHGVLNLVAQAEQIGHMAQTLSNSVLDNYHHLGDAAGITDGLHYDPRLKPYQKSADGKSSGTPDDMWAFTSRNPGLDLQAATMFAAASRVLTEKNPDLARRALKQSIRLDEEATKLMAADTTGRFRRRNQGNSFSTALQLYVSTKDPKYLAQFTDGVWPALERMPNNAIGAALDAIPYLDNNYKEKLRPYVEKYRDYILSLEEQNPYGVPIGLGNWAGGGQVTGFGTTVCNAHRHFPDIVGKEHIYKAPAWLFGCHPYHNYSWVAAVGAARPKQVFYGNNRADFSFIPGNMAPGLLFRQPDHFENYDDWPFLWGQNEGTIAGNTGYLIFGETFRNVQAN
ncbi:MAG: glycoside hydrolase family 9 protein [Bacteroidales bacterium]|nr:glycoside hydrolase family 9 protein [Bacteroidales bacterium]